VVSASKVLHINQPRSYSIAVHCYVRTAITIEPRNSLSLNTFTAIIDLSQFNNSCLKTPASTLVNLIFQSRCFCLNQLTCHYRQEACTAAQYIYLTLLTLRYNEPVFILMLSESGLSLAAVYKESFIHEVVYV
jgi:hypothetical protein